MDTDSISIKDSLLSFINDKELLEITLQNIIEHLPAHIYWKDIDGKYLGCNNMQANSLGFKSHLGLVGKTDFELPWSEGFAEEFRANDLEVMQTGTVKISEESSIMAGRNVIVFSQKVPLKNKDGEIIGILGISLDITDRKEKDQLTIENERHQAAALEQEKFTNVVKQVMHDITAPISSINNIVERLSNIIPENERVTLRHASERIAGISQRLLKQYNKEEDTGEEIFVVSLALLQIVNEQREAYRDSGVNIEVSIKESAHFSCICHNLSMFNRMIANLIKNAVEALDGVNDGRVKIKLSAANNKVAIIITDNGPGMPATVQESFKNGGMIVTSKMTGHGIGLSQVRDAITAGNGEYSIYTSAGTKISIWFPHAENLAWIATEIKLTIDDTLIILDDDESIHGSWNSSLKAVLEKYPTIKVLHYTDGKDAINYINSLNHDEKEHIFLLTDFELLDQGVDGLDVIRQTKISRTILVTSYSANHDIQGEVAKIGVKMLPKELAHAAKITVDKKIPKWSRSVDMVWVEDQTWVVKDLVSKYYSHLSVDIYDNPINFMNDIHQYPLDTKIILDTYYETKDHEMYEDTGYDLAARLHKMGYNKLILYTGEENKQGAPDYLTVIYKSDPEAWALINKV